MFPDRVSNPGPLTYKSDAQPIALHSPAETQRLIFISLLKLSFSKCFSHTMFCLEYLCFYVQIFYSQINNPLFTQLSDFLWIRYCKGAYSLSTFHSAKFGFALRHYFSRGATVQCCCCVCSDSRAIYLRSFQR